MAARNRKRKEAQLSIGSWVKALSFCVVLGGLVLLVRKKLEKVHLGILYLYDGMVYMTNSRKRIFDLIGQNGGF